MRAARTDANQVSIAAALRKVGCSVQSLAMVGDGCPDLLVGCGRENVLLELKDGEKVLSKRQLTPDQVRWHESWRGTVHIVTSAEQALAIVGAIRRGA